MKNDDINLSSCLLPADKRCFDKDLDNDLQEEEEVFHFAIPIVRPG